MVRAAPDDEGGVESDADGEPDADRTTRRAAGQDRGVPTGPDSEASSSSPTGGGRGAGRTRTVPSQDDGEGLLEEAQGAIEGFKRWTAGNERAKDEFLQGLQRKLLPGVRTERGPYGSRGIDFGGGTLGQVQDTGQRTLKSLSLGESPEEARRRAAILPALANPGGIAPGLAALLGISFVGGGKTILQEEYDVPEDPSAMPGDVRVPEDGQPVRSGGELRVPDDTGRGGEIRIPEDPGASRGEIRVPDPAARDPLQFNFTQSIRQARREQRQIDRARERGDTRTVERIRQRQRERQKRQERREILRGPDDAVIGRIDEGATGVDDAAEDTARETEEEPEEEPEPATEEVEQEVVEEEPETVEDTVEEDADLLEFDEPGDEEFEPGEFGAEPGNSGSDPEATLVAEMVERGEEASRRFDEQADEIEGADDDLVEIIPGELDVGDPQFDLLDEAEAPEVELEDGLDELLEDVGGELEDAGDALAEQLDDLADVAEIADVTEALANPQIQIPELVFPDISTTVNPPAMGDPTVPETTTDYPNPPEYRFPAEPGPPGPPETPVRLPVPEFPDDERLLERLERLFSKEFENPVASYDEIVGEVDVPDPSGAADEALERAERQLEGAFE